MGDINVEISSDEEMEDEELEEVGIMQLREQALLSDNIGTWVEDPGAGMVELGTGEEDLEGQDGGLEVLDGGQEDSEVESVSDSGGEEQQLDGEGRGVKRKLSGIFESAIRGSYFNQ